MSNEQAEGPLEMDALEEWHQTEDLGTLGNFWMMPPKQQLVAFERSSLGLSCGEHTPVRTVTFPAECPGQAFCGSMLPQENPV